MRLFEERAPNQVEGQHLSPLHLDLGAEGGKGRQREKTHVWCENTVSPGHVADAGEKAARCGPPCEGHPLIRLMTEKETQNLSLRLRCACVLWLLCLSWEQTCVCAYGLG